MDLLYETPPDREPSAPARQYPRGMGGKKRKTSIMSSEVQQTWRLQLLPLRNAYVITPVPSSSSSSSSCNPPQNSSKFLITPMLLYMMSEASFSPFASCPPPPFSNFSPFSSCYFVYFLKTLNQQSRSVLAPILPGIRKKQINAYKKPKKRGLWFTKFAFKQQEICSPPFLTPSLLPRGLFCFAK